MCPLQRAPLIVALVVDRLLPRPHRVLGIAVAHFAGADEPRPRGRLGIDDVEILAEAPFEMAVVILRPARAARVSAEQLLLLVVRRDRLLGVVGAPGAHVDQCAAGRGLFVDAFLVGGEAPVQVTVVVTHRIGAPGGPGEPAHLHGVLRGFRGGLRGIAIAGGVVGRPCGERRPCQGRGDQQECQRFHVSDDSSHEQASSL